MNWISSRWGRIVAGIYAGMVLIAGVVAISRLWRSTEMPGLAAWELLLLGLAWSLQVRFGQLDQLQDRIPELEERVDFAERILARQQESQRVSLPQNRAAGFAAHVKRVLVIGPGGAGKTTVARRLAQCTGLPLIHLDSLYWQPGWIPMAADEWRTTVERLTRAETWIMDGNYGGTLDVRLRACDTVVFLDRGRLLCLWRVAVRQLRHFGHRRPERPAGCRERLTWQFLWWIWTYRSRRRGKILDRLRSVREEKHVTILRSGKAIERFLRDACRETA